MSTLTIKHFMPDVGALHAMAPEERGRLLLQFLQYANRALLPLLNRSHLLQPQHFLSYEPEERAIVIACVKEAWVWLEQRGFIAPMRGQTNGWCYITPEGELLADAENSAAFKKAPLFPEALLHPAIRDCAHPQFVRGEYPRAVFQAFKEVEIAVREATDDHVKDTDSLMRKAFATGEGVLTDRSASAALQQGVLELFAGALAYFKNISAQQQKDMQAEEALEMIMFASHLRRMVDQRKLSSRS